MSERTKIRSWRASAPKSVRVGPHLYTVEIKDSTYIDQKDQLVVFGEHSFLNQKISLLGYEEAATKSYLSEVAIHEVLHALWAERGLPKKNEEEIVSKLGIALTHFAQTNPEFMKWWMKGCQK